jgi:hypothetical protein
MEKKMEQAHTDVPPQTTDVSSIEEASALMISGARFLGAKELPGGFIVFSFEDATSILSEIRSGSRKFTIPELVMTSGQFKAALKQLKYARKDRQEHRQ